MALLVAVLVRSRRRWLLVLGALLLAMGIDDAYMLHELEVFLTSRYRSAANQTTSAGPLLVVSSRSARCLARRWSRACSRPASRALRMASPRPSCSSARAIRRDAGVKVRCF